MSYITQDLPVGTRCRPDIVAYEEKRLAGTRYHKQEYTRKDDLTWAQAEVTAEYLSSGTTMGRVCLKPSHTPYTTSSPDQIGWSYPDFTSARRFFAGASGMCNTKLEWGNRDHLQLLYDFVGRIIDPSPGMVDPNIVRVTNDTFGVMLKAKTYHRCEIILYPLENRSNSERQYSRSTQPSGGPTRDQGALNRF